MGSPAALARVKLALDHHYSPAIAIELRARGHDVCAAIERGWQTEEDEALLEICATEQRVLVTNNVADFAIIARRWAIAGRGHCGLIFTSDASMPRGRQSIGSYVDTVDELLIANHDAAAFTDRTHWL